MSHCTFWPGKNFFYPIGNTSPVCFSQNLAPEEKADVLLLGCGDPRSILFTVYATRLISKTTRAFDITCCDMEVGILARNILLFSFLIDEEDASLPNLSQVWNVFYNMFLDEDSLSLLFSQSRKLLDCSTTLNGWHASKYGNILRICTGNTLDRVRLIWKHYIGVSSMSTNDRKDFERRFSAGMKNTKVKNMGVYFALRSAGPVFMETRPILGEAYEEYVRSGIITSDVDYRKKANFANPSFAYTSLSGDKFAVHYATDPLSVFHLAEAFAPLTSVQLPKTKKLTVQDVVDTTVAQFRRWCSAFVSLLRPQDHLGLITIRFIAAEVLSFCDALQYYSVTGDSSTPFYTGPWQATTISLSDDYGGSGNAPFSAPVKFNVIDTSNLVNHVGILHILVSCCPLLQTTASATLFTEALGSLSENSLTALLDQACMSLSMLTLLLGVTPASCVTKYTTVSNAHEIIFLRANSSRDNANAQFHERIAWKFATGSDGDGSMQRSSAFPDAKKLADALFDTYLKMFQNENPFSTKPSQAGIANASFIHYTRRSFAQLIGTTKRRIQANWPAVMAAFNERVINDKVLLLGSNYYQEMNCQFHILGVITMDTLRPGYVQKRRQLSSSTAFHEWASIPEVVCIALTVPRSAISRWEAHLNKCGTPFLLGNVISMRSGFHNTFGCIHIVHGTLSTTGVGEHRRGVIHGDSRGFFGESPMVATFVVPAWFLLFPEVRVAISVLSTPVAVQDLVKELGLQLQLFSADLSDKTHVHILPERPDIRAEPTTLACMIGGRQFEVDDSHIAVVTLGNQSQSGEVDTMMVRADTFDVEVKSALADGAAVSIVQHSPCTAELVIGTFKSLLRYPIPIDVARAKLRIARKSSYVEVIAPSALGMVGSKSSIGLFPLFRNGQNLAPWNIHQLHLDRLPALDTTAPERIKWLSPLLGITLSDRERTMAKSKSGICADVLANIKESLASIILHSCGLWDHGIKRAFSLNEPSMGGYTLIFVAGIRLDLQNHSIVVDAWILPLTLSILPSIAGVLGELSPSMLQIITDTEEMHAWKRLIPAFVERCRTWTHKKNCPYVKKSPPLSLELAESSICQCGAGVGTSGGFGKVEAWKPFAPYVTRAALSPLFVASFMEPVAGKLADGAKATHTSKASVSGLSCAKCGKGGEKLLSCSRCKKLRYCGTECQREHWKVHKLNCA